MSRSRLNRAGIVAFALTLAACNSTVASPEPTRPAASALATAAPQATAAAIATRSPVAKPTRNPSAGYTDLKGWLVFEHFGQAPDGSTPTFDFNNRMIWMVHADGSGLHELSPSVPAGGKSSPDISPDGRTVAFNTWSEPIQIWTEPIDGGQPTLVTTDCDGLEAHCIEREPNYSADGKKLAFARDWYEKGVSYSGIGVRDLATGQVKMLDSTKTDGSSAYVTQPSVSPDGSHVVFYRVAQTPSQDHPTGTTVVVAATDGSSAHDLPHPLGSDWASDPDWSPDGKSIVFAIVPNREGEGWDDFPGGDGIWSVAPDGTNLHVVCDMCLSTPVGRLAGMAPTWTADGRILFWGYKTWALMNADGSDAAHINMAKLTWNGDGLGFNYAGFLQPTP